MTEIINNQRKIKLDWEIFQTFAEKVIEIVDEAGKKCATIAFVSDRKMRALNKQFRGKHSTTDVLSFPFEADEFTSESSIETDNFSADFLGDVIISLEQAQKQAHENNLDFETEIKQLILHGVLHLCGYDHETDDGEMNVRELTLRDALQI